MNSQELYDGFLLQYDINGSASAVGFTDDEIYTFLTKAQLRVTDMISTSSSLDDLQELKLTTVADVYDSEYDVSNIWSCTELNDVYKFISGTVRVIRSGIVSSGAMSPVKLKPIDEQYISELYVTDYNKPIYEWVYIFMKANRPHLIHDAYVSTISTATITYIKLPQNITSTVSASLNEKYHKNIIDEAVSLALYTASDIRAKKT
jgi:hypothetical protein